jgi:hypothetical protein
MSERIEQFLELTISGMHLRAFAPVVARQHPSVVRAAAA